MLTCAECGEKYRPMTDAYKCPCCGAPNYPDEQENESPSFVFSNCNVCGRKLHTKAEDEMGMCERCAGENGTIKQTAGDCR